MSRPNGSKNVEKPPRIIEADETERLEYIAALLLEIAEDELQQSEDATCSRI
jgi:hypothetical protein